MTQTCETCGHWQRDILFTDGWCPRLEMNTMPNETCPKWAIPAGNALSDTERLPLDQLNRIAYYADKLLDAIRSHSEQEISVGYQALHNAMTPWREAQWKRERDAAATAAQSTLTEGE